MQGEMVPVVLLPRFTTFAGGGRYETAPLDVTDYDRLVVEYGCGTVYGGGSVTVLFEESHDGIEWFELDSTAVAVDVRVDLTRRWLRVAAVVGSGKAITCWCQGQLRRRVG